jgi:hypothetical protein
MNNPAIPTLMPFAAFFRARASNQAVDDVGHFSKAICWRSVDSLMRFQR